VYLRVRSVVATGRSGHDDSQGVHMMIVESCNTTGYRPRGWLTKVHQATMEQRREGHSLVDYVLHSLVVTVRVTIHKNI
jgi:hypothetical protein